MRSIWCIVRNIIMQIRQPLSNQWFAANIWYFVLWSRYESALLYLFYSCSKKQQRKWTRKYTYSDSAAVPNNNFLKCSYSFRTRCRETFIECRFLSMNFYCPRIFMYFRQTLNRFIFIMMERIFIKKKEKKKIIRKTSCKCDNI